MEDELEQIRQRRHAQIREGDVDQSQVQEAMAHAQEEQYQAQRQMILRKILTPEARLRLSNIRMARPDVVENIENQLIQLAAAGRIGIVDEAMLKKLLKKLIPATREIKIERR